MSICVSLNQEQSPKGLMSRDTIASIQRLKNIQLVSLKPETECMIMQTIIQRQLRNAHVNRSEVARCGASRY
ncbi:hypothetical protein HYQ45_009579 [Verticillium longisporum]|uniref:Uncharacterized protein n=1 Tax=Verticillium longisporum TaxID=100787 RepID=A0A8I3APQ2_VERLO|nr:hypothetical protein HYQ45_009579 [Verticillium longisporum]